MVKGSRRGGKRRTTRKTRGGGALEECVNEYTELLEYLNKFQEYLKDCQKKTKASGFCAAPCVPEAERRFKTPKQLKTILECEEATGDVRFQIQVLEQRWDMLNAYRLQKLGLPPCEDFVENNNFSGGGSLEDCSRRLLMLERELHNIVDWLEKMGVPEKKIDAVLNGPLPGETPQQTRMRQLMPGYKGRGVTSLKDCEMRIQELIFFISQLERLL